MKFTANLEIIKSRLTERMIGDLPKPVEQKIERQVVDWESVESKLNIQTSSGESNKVAKEICDFALELHEIAE